MITLLFMPFTIVATSAGEWIFGRTDEIRNRFCRIQGIVYILATGLTFDSLAVISVDRFLTIMWFDIHQRFMTWKTAHGIMIFMWVSRELHQQIIYILSSLTN